MYFFNYKSFQLIRSEAKYALEQFGEKVNPQTIDDEINRLFMEMGYKISRIQTKGDKKVILEIFGRKFRIKKTGSSTVTIFCDHNERSIDLRSEYEGLDDLVYFVSQFRPEKERIDTITAYYIRSIAQYVSKL